MPPATTRSTCSTSICRAARAIANPPIPAGRNRRDIDLPWGRIGHICYDVRRALSRARRKRRRSSPCRRPSPEDRRSALAHPAARPRHRTGCLYSPPRAACKENKRETLGFADHRTLGRDPQGGRAHVRRDRPLRVETARKTVPSLQHGRRFGIADPKAGPEHLHLVRGSA